MRTLLFAACVAGICVNANSASETIISVKERNGTAYVSSADLERGAGIAIKKLRNDAVVACSEDRCALVKDFLRDGDETLINVTELSNALGFAPRFSDGRRHVQFETKSQSSPANSAITGVGDLAPNFRVARLDGRPVSLTDFRGKRVLIQSWASW